MLGLANKPTSVFKSLSLLQMQQGGGDVLGMSGDVYIITDTRKNPRKELDKMRSLQRYNIEPYTPETAFASESGTVLFPVKDLHFDRKNFQNRETDFSDESVWKIIKAVKDGKFNWAVFDAITIWQNPSDGKFYVLSGHSRSEAFKRLAEMGESADGKNFTKIPAKIFKGTFDEARDLALNSNTLSTKETNFERANYYRALYNSEIAKGRSKAEATNVIMPLIREREGKNANSIFYISFLNPDGIFYDALRQLQNAPTQDRERLKVVGEWVGRLRKDRSKLTDFHERELFDYLITQGNYNKTVTNYADLLKRIDTALLKMVDEKGNFQPERSLNLKRNIVAEGNEKAFLQELDRLKRVAADDENLYNQKLAEFRNRQKIDSTITDEQILKAVEPYRQRAILSKADYNAFRQKRAQYIDADRRQTSLFGLGKPTIKFEFEDNADLFNFFAKKNDYSNAQNVDFENVATSTVSNGKRGASRTQSAITTPETLYLPYSEGSKALPGSVNPKSLPPSSAINIPTLKSVLKPEGVFLDKRKIGDYGYINDNLKYVNLFINREYAVHGRIFDFAEQIFPGAVIIICFQDSNGIWKFYFRRPQYKDFIYKKFPNSFIQNRGIKYFIFDLQHIEKVIQAFESEGYPVVLVYRNIVDDINDIPHPSSPKALPPSGLENDETKYYSVGLGKPTVKFEFEDNAEIFKTFGSGVSGLTVNDKPAALFNCPESLLQCKGFTPSYIRLEDYSRLIEPATGEKKLVGYGFEVSTLNELANACNHWKDVARLASHLKADNVLQSAFNAWHWLHTNIRYNYDTPGEEEIRTPARSWADRENGVDCDCIAVFTACLLGAMGYKPKFEIVAFNNSPKFSHIYVNLDGAAIDRVLPVFLARPENITKTKIMDIPVFELSGTADGGFSTLNGIYADTLLKVNSGTANAQDSMDLRKTQVLLGLQKSDPQAYKLAAILMPYVVAIDDNGSYYFATDKVAEIAENADKKLYSLKISGANQAAFDEFFNSIVGEMKNISVRLERGNGKTIVTISFTNPQNDTYNVEGEFLKKDMLAINPDFLTMRNALKNLIAVNYYDLATRFAVGLMNEVNAVQAGYTPETWQKAVEATNKLKKLWTLLGGDVETLIQVIESGAEKEAVVDVDGDTSIIETSAFDSVLHGCKYNALSGINGLGETSTVNSELDTLGEGFETLLEWVAEIEPGETVNISITKTSDGESNIRYASTMQDSESNNKAWLWLLGGAVVGGGIAAATSGKKNKKSKR